eukprot:1404568-Pyramimonas_sp.AAC.1
MKTWVQFLAPFSTERKGALTLTRLRDRCGAGKCDAATGVCRCPEGAGGAHCELPYCFGTSHLEVPCGGQ